MNFNIFSLIFSLLSLLFFVLSWFCCLPFFGQDCDFSSLSLPSFRLCSCLRPSFVRELLFLVRFSFLGEIFFLFSSFCFLLLSWTFSGFIFKETFSLFFSVEVFFHFFCCFFLWLSFSHSLSPFFSFSHSLSPLLWLFRYSKKEQSCLSLFPPFSLLSKLLAIQWCKPHLILLPLDLSDAMCTLGNFISFWIVDSECIFNLLGWCLRGGFESHFPFTSV